MLERRKELSRACARYSVSSVSEGRAQFQSVQSSYGPQPKWEQIRLEDDMESCHG